MASLPEKTKKDVQKVRETKTGTIYLNGTILKRPWQSCVHMHLATLRLMLQTTGSLRECQLCVGF